MTPSLPSLLMAVPMDLEQPRWGISRKSKREGAEDEGRDSKSSKTVTAQALVDTAKASVGGKGKSKEAVVSALIKLVTKLSLGHARDISEIMGALCLTFLVEADCFLVPPLRDAGAAYFEEAKRLGKGHDLGPPHIHVWSALLSAVIANNKLDLTNRRVLRAYWQQVLVMSDKTKLDQDIKICRLRKCYAPKGKEPTHYKLQLCLSTARQVREIVVQAEGDQPRVECSLMDALTALLCEAGAVQKVGKAPRGALEREAEALLAQLE